MAKLNIAFNANNIDPTQGPGQLPLGRHPVIIKTSEVKGSKTNAQSGMLSLGLEVIAGEHQGATGVHNLNIYNENPQTVDIANRQLSAICHVTGVFLIEDTQQLHNIPFVVEVTNQKLTREQQEKKDAGQTVTPYTQVSRVFTINGEEPRRGGGAAPVQQQQAPAPQQQAQQGQQQPAPQSAPAGAWGSPATAAPAPQAAPTPAPAPAWGGQAAAPAAAPVAGGWNTAAPAAGGTPGWAA